ncbi:MAG TPA: hypothetical protein VN154_11970 [Rhizomicrobium sp.]|nr:hypothetical protein [Rhizomicrobium sp.]
MKALGQPGIAVVKMNGCLRSRRENGNLRLPSAELPSVIDRVWLPVSQLTFATSLHAARRLSSYARTQDRPAIFSKKRGAKPMAFGADDAFTTTRMATNVFAISNM